MYKKPVKEKPRKVKVELEEDLVLKLNALKKTITDTYSDVLRRLLK